jgi:hypothetical protein
MKPMIMAVVCLTCLAGRASAQSKTTQNLDERYEGLSLYFYKNTLRMLNQKDDPDFDALIRNIEKMKFLMIDKTSSQFGNTEYKKLVGAYQGEAFEPVMTSRHQGRNFDIYVKDKANSPLSTVVLVNDSTSLFVLDMVGTIDVSKASSLFSSLDGSTDIGKKIKNFMEKKEGEKEKKQN